jgi:spore coat polysaccharide biosynthesis protein SpsF
MRLGDTTVIDQVVRRAEQFSSQVVVCTSVDPSDDPIEVHCNRQGILCIRGPLEDVFSRFRIALEDPRVERTEWFARVTADCPLLSVVLARLLIACISQDLDYICVDDTMLTRGLAIELIRRQTFESIDLASLDGTEREHVTLRLYETPGLYRCHQAAAPVDLAHPNLRLTLDYPEDYRLLRNLILDNDTITAEQALERLICDPQLQHINAGCVQKQPRLV